MKKLLTLIAAVMITVSAVYAEETKVETKTTTETTESSSIGLSGGVDFWSHYIWRGTNFYGDQPVFFPWVSYAVGETGLSITVGLEHGAERLGADDDANAFKVLSAADFAVAYDKTLVKDTLSFGVNLWNFYFYESKSDETGDVDYSFSSLSVYFTVDALPLAPTITYTHDYYWDEDFCADKKNKNDFYVVLSLGHDVELVKGSTLNIGASMGYFNARSLGEKVKGVSDINLSATLTTEAGGATLYGGFVGTYVPAPRFFRISGEDDKLKFWAKFGASYAL